MDMNIHPTLARISLALLLSLCLSGPVLASPEHDLRLIEEQRQHAIRAKDFAALSNIYAPDFLGVTGTGQLLRRDDLFRVFERTDPALHSPPTKCGSSSTAKRLSSLAGSLQQRRPGSRSSRHASLMSSSSAVRPGCVWPARPRRLPRADRGVVD